jgi:hypothetical protein
MTKFVIEPHFRLHEWLAHDQGYFAQHGLDYEFRELIRSTDGKHHDTAGKAAGAFQSIEKGRESNVTCACHWTVNVAASNGHTKLYANAYSVAPAGIFVAADSPIRSPTDLAGVPVSVGFQSGSHYATIQALEPYLAQDQLKLSFGEGMLFARMEALFNGTAPAVALFNGPYYFAEQLGFRKIIDTTFMIAAMINGEPSVQNVERYFQALRQSQRDIDLRPERYTHYYLREFPERFHSAIDTRRWGPGERIVFEPYTRQVYEQSFEWIARHEIFAPGAMGQANYDQAVFATAPAGPARAPKLNS